MCRENGALNHSRSMSARTVGRIANDREHVINADRLTEQVIGFVRPLQF